MSTNMILNAVVPMNDIKESQRRRTGWKNRTKFTKEEDKILKSLVEKYGEDMWSQIVENMPDRSCRQCRERWFNYLSPSLNKTKWKAGEDDLLLKKVTELGKKWVAISKLFRNRTDQMLKNRYNVLMRIHQKCYDESDDYYEPKNEPIKRPKVMKAPNRKNVKNTQQPPYQPQKVALVHHPVHAVKQQEQEVRQQTESTVDNDMKEQLDFYKLFDEADFQLFLYGDATDIFSF